MTARRLKRTLKLSRDASASIVSTTVAKRADARTLSRGSGSSCSTTCGGC